MELYKKGSELMSNALLKLLLEDKKQAEIKTIYPYLFRSNNKKVVIKCI